VLRTFSKNTTALLQQMFLGYAQKQFMHQTLFCITIFDHSVNEKEGNVERYILNPTGVEIL
jgi:hypothetical protein